MFEVQFQAEATLFLFKTMSKLALRAYPVSYTTDIRCKAADI
jgi:hypothetical protein